MSNKRQLSLLWPAEFVEAVDLTRGTQSRAGFIKAAVEARLGDGAVVAAEVVKEDRDGLYVCRIKGEAGEECDFRHSKPVMCPNHPGHRLEELF